MARIRIVVVAGVLLAVLTAVPGRAVAVTPTCTPPTPTIVGFVGGLTVRAPSCADQTGVTSYEIQAYDPVFRGTVAVHRARGSQYARIPSRINTVTNVNVPYQVRMRAVGSDGPGPWSAYSERATAPFASPTEAVASVYRDFARRAPTSAELADGIERVRSSWFVDLMDPLQKAPYWQALDPATQMYLAFLVKSPDHAGLMYWAGRRRSGLSIAALAQSFATSSQFRTKYGALANRAYVRRMYLNILGHLPDPDGEDYWTRQIDTHHWSRGQLAAHLIAGFPQQWSRERVLVISYLAALWHQTGSLAGIDDAIQFAEHENLPFIAISGSAYSDRLPRHPGPPVISTGDFGTWKLGVAKSRKLSVDPATGSSTAGSSTWSATGLPPGITVSTHGTFSGTPTQVGTYSVRFTVTDTAHQVDHKISTITIAAA